ncbi:MAG: sulfatase [Planctomycetota bacterium]
MRRFVRLIPLLLVQGAPASLTQTPERPNVLLISIDDLNDWVGVLGGHPQARTPHIDALAERGVLFANAHCQAPVCTPSRASLFTGRLPTTTGMYFLQPPLAEVEGLQGVTTLTQRFEAEGYVTLGAGKLYHGSGEEQRFQVYGGGLGGFGPRPEPKLHYPEGHPLWDWGPWPETDAEMPDTRIADWAIERLGEERTSPFFLAVGFWRPHVPMCVPERWFDLHPVQRVLLPEVLADDRGDLSPYATALTIGHPAPRHEWMLEHDQWLAAVRAYLASSSFVDHQVGRVLTALAESRYASNTIVVLFSDHGFHLGEKERWAKRSLWEDATRVPLVIAVPGRDPRVSERPVGLLDIYPTLLELCGLETDEGLEGRSLVPLMDDPRRDWPWPAITTFGPGNHALRTTRWRYIRYRDGSEELYDHDADEHEWRNLAGDPRFEPLLVEYRRWLPEREAPLLQGSESAGRTAWRAAEKL